MATDKGLTKEQLLEALNKNGINTLEDLVDSLMPETGGYRILFSENTGPRPLITIPIEGSKGLIGLDMHWYDVDVEG